MQEVEVEPGRGIGPVNLGAARGDVRELLADLYCSSRGPGDDEDKDRESTDYYAENSLQVASNSAGRVVLIEIGCEPLKVLLGGREVLRLKDSEAVEFVRSTLRIEPVEKSRGHSYLFPAANLSLWRSTTALDRFDTIAVSVPGYWTT